MFKLTAILFVLCTHGAPAWSASDLYQTQNFKDVAACVVNKFSTILTQGKLTKSDEEFMNVIGNNCEKAANADSQASYDVAVCLDKNFDNVMDAVTKSNKVEDLAFDLQTVCSDYLTAADKGTLSNAAKGTKSKYLSETEDCFMGESEKIKATKANAANKSDFVWMAELIPICKPYDSDVQTYLEFAGCISKATSKDNAQSYVDSCIKM